MTKTATPRHLPECAPNCTTPVSMDDLRMDDWPWIELVHCDGTGTGYEFTLETCAKYTADSFIVHWYIWLDEEPAAMSWDHPDEILWLPDGPDPDDPADDPDDPEPVLVGGSDWYACH